MLSRQWGAALPMVFAVLLVPGWCAAQESRDEPIVTDRPDFTESTDTIPVGRIQIEGGYTFVRTGDEKSDSLGELLLRLSLGPKSELRVGVPNYARLRGPVRSSGFEDASLGAKFRLAEAGEGFGLRRPAVSLIVATSLPTGARAHRSNELQPEAKLCLSADLSETLAVAANLNYAYASDDGDRYGEPSGSLSFAVGLNEKVGAYLEYFGFYPSGAERSSSHYLNGGATYLINSDYQLDARIGKGLNGVNDDYFLGFGAARRF